MNSEQIIQEATEAVEKGLPCAYLVPHLLEVAKNQKLEIEILIRKKEALRDEIAEQQAEIERLRKDRDELYEEMSERQKAEVAIAKRMGKSEAYREFAERLKSKADRGFWQERSYVDTEDIDTTLKELTEKNDKG